MILKPNLYTYFQEEFYKNMTYFFVKLIRLITVFLSNGNYTV